MSRPDTVTAFDWLLAVVSTFAWVAATLNATSCFGKVILWGILLMHAVGWGVLLGLLATNLL